MGEGIKLMIAALLGHAAFIARVMTSTVSGGKDAFEKSFMRSNLSSKASRGFDFCQ
jgi:hypothetical protein